jgi:hypothetical protein
MYTQSHDTDVGTLNFLFKFARTIGKNNAIDLSRRCEVLGNGANTDFSRKEGGLKARTYENWGKVKELYLREFDRIRLQNRQAEYGTISIEREIETTHECVPGDGHWKESHDELPAKKKVNLRSLFGLGARTAKAAPIKFVEDDDDEMACRSKYGAECTREKPC